MTPRCWQTKTWQFRVMKSSLVDRRERFIAYDPRVVPWWEQWNVARLKDHFAAVVRDEKDACCESGVSRASFAEWEEPRR